MSKIMSTWYLNDPLKKNQDQITLGNFLLVFCSYHSHRFGVSRGPSEGSDQSNETNVVDLDSMRSWNKTAGRAMVASRGATVRCGSNAANGPSRIQ